MTEEKIIEKPRCNKCGSSQIYLRFKTKERYCRMCGHIEEIEKKDGDE